jgi:hypothetical protein
MRVNDRGAGMVDSLVDLGGVVSSVVSKPAD